MPFRPELPVTVIKTEDAPLTVSTDSTLPAPKSATSTKCRNKDVTVRTDSEAFRSAGTIWQCGKQFRCSAITILFGGRLRRYEQSCYESKRNSGSQQHSPGIV